MRVTMRVRRMEGTREIARNHSISRVATPSLKVENRFVFTAAA
jgi:hypothetical protein